MKLQLEKQWTFWSWPSSFKRLLVMCVTKRSDDLLTIYKRKNYMRYCSYFVFTFMDDCALIIGWTFLLSNNILLQWILLYLIWILSMCIGFLYICFILKINLSLCFKDVELYKYKKLMSTDFITKKVVLSSKSSRNCWYEN